jgi:hypothetical protein
MISRTASTITFHNLAEVQGIVYTEFDRIPLAIEMANFNLEEEV